MDRFDFMKRLQDRIDEVQTECHAIEKKIEYHKVRSAESLGLFPPSEEDMHPDAVKALVIYPTN